jgi:hypothetical protein
MANKSIIIFGRQLHMPHYNAAVTIPEVIQDPPGQLPGKRPTTPSSIFCITTAMDPWMNINQIWLYISLT